MVYPRFHRIPTVTITPDRLRLSLVRLVATPLISLQRGLQALLLHYFDMNYDPLAASRRLCYLTITVLRRFHTEPGKAFALYFLIHRKNRGNTIPSPGGGIDRRCAFPEVPLAFGLQNASHHQYALACGYLQSPALTEPADPSQTFMVSALGCSLGLSDLAWIKHSAC